MSRPSGGSPRAPARIAANTVSSSSCIVRTRTATCGAPSTSRRVASIPSSPGMLTSISTTSGWVVPARRIASSPVVASPASSMSGAVPSSDRRPDRNEAWSSATRTRMRSPPGCRCHVLLAHVAAGPASGSRARTRVPPPACGSTRSSPPSSSARADIDSMPVPATNAGRVAGAVVRHLDLEHPAGGDAHAAGPRVGVAHGVRHRLDRDPVRGDLDRGRQVGERRGRAGDRDPDRRIARPALQPTRLLVDRGDEPHLVDRRRSQAVDQPPDVRERDADLGRQLLQQRPGRSRVVVERRRGRLGPHPDRGQRRPQPVVQVAPQPAPLLLAREHEPFARSDEVVPQPDRAHGRARLAAEIREQRQLVVVEALLAAAHAQHEPPDGLRAAHERDGRLRRGRRCR